MKLAMVMLVAYLPFFWWMYKQTLEDMEKAKSESQNR